MQLLWEREVDARVLAAGTWDGLTQRRFDDPTLFSAYLHTLR